MNDWFTVDAIDKDTFVISEYRHWEETHCYLLNGTQRSLLIDTGLGICDISQVTAKLTDRPITAVATHVHWDHIGGHKYYPDFYAHERELGARRICPGHHSLAVTPELVIQVRDAFRQLKEEGKLCHGSGMFDYGDFAVLL